MKKRLSVFLCAILMIATFAACGGGDATPASEPEAAPVEESSEAAAEPETPAEPEEASESEAPAETAATDELPAAQGVDGKNIGVCIYKFDDNFMTLYRNELERYLTAGGATVQVMDGKNDQAEQTNQINNFITQGVDALIINLVQASAAPQITDICAAAGIPVVFINREPDVAEEERWQADGIKATYVGADARQSGTYQGEIISSLPNKGDADGDGTLRYVMIMGDPENVDAQYRTEFSIKALVDAGGWVLDGEAPTIEKLFEQRGDWDQIKGQELTANALAAHGAKIDVVFCNNDSMAMGALQAIEGASRKVNEDIYLVGVDALAEALEAIGEGRMTGTVFNDHFSQARTAGDKVADYIAGTEVANVNMVDYVKVTPDNAADILAMLG